MSEIVLEKLLDVYHSVTPLKQFIEETIQPPNLRDVLNPSLEKDERERYQHLLNQTYIAIENPVDSQLIPDELAQELRERQYSYRKLIEMIVKDCYDEDCMRRRKWPPTHFVRKIEYTNVLCLGRGGDTVLDFLNLSLTAFNLFEWRYLHSKIGPSWIYALLRKCSIFVYLEDRCSMVQLTGISFIEYRKQKKKEQNERERQDEQKKKEQNEQKENGEREEDERKQQNEEEENEDGQKKRTMENEHQQPNKKRKITDNETISTTLSIAPTPLANSSKILIFKDKCFYGRPILNKSEKVTFGLKRSCLKRNFFFDSKPVSETASPSLHAKCVLFHIFPLQFNQICKLTDPDYDPREALISTRKERKEHVKVVKNAHFSKTRLVKSINTTSIAHILDRVISRSQHVRYSLLLNKSCPIEGLDAILNGKLGWDMVENKPLFSEFHCVTKFICLVIDDLFPFETFGSQHNWSLVKKKIGQYIKLRKSETISLYILFEGFRISEIPWLAPAGIASTKMARPDFQKRQELFLEFIFWFFDSFVISLIKSNFYTTELSGDYNIRYYRHDIWKHIFDNSISIYIREKLELQSALERNKNQQQNEDELASGIRLLPKPEGYRVIITLGKGLPRHKKSRFEPQTSVNTRIKPLFQVLTSSALKHHTKGKSSLSNQNEIFERLRIFREKFRPVPKKFYFVKADISKCFDNISVSKAYQIASDIIKGEIFWIQKFHTFNCKADGGKYVGHFKEVARELTSPLTLNETISDVYGRKQSEKNAIFVDHSIGDFTDRPKVIKLLDEILRKCLVEINNKQYYLSKGIAQGSSISSLLCNLVCDTVEKNHIRFNEGKSILFRYVDDFLFVSSDQREAEEFLVRMSEGFSAFGVKINPKKTVTNFETSMNTQVLKSAATDGFPYIGRTIHCHTFRSMDFNRVSKTDIVRAAFHKGTAKKTREAMSTKLSRILNTKIHENVLNSIAQCKKRTIMKYFTNIAVDIAGRIKVFDRICLQRAAKNKSGKVIIGWLIRTLRSIIRKFESTKLADVLTSVDVMKACVKGYRAQLQSRKYIKVFQEFERKLL